MLEDNEIVEMYFMRDQQAIVRTDEKYGKLCRTISVRIVSDSRDAEECVSDTYMHAWNSIPPQRPQSLAASATFHLTATAERTRKNVPASACHWTSFQSAFPTRVSSRRATPSFPAL